MRTTLPPQATQKRDVPVRRLVAAIVLLAALAPAQRARVDAEHLSTLSWQAIGPAAMGGRITALAIHPERPAVWFVGTATGGVFRTKNGGLTFEPVFERFGSSSVGHVAIAPSNPDVIWVGTGEANARNSASFGDGVYKSEDGGDSFTPMGLSETRHIGRIAIDPTDPNRVFVAALGRFWGPNPERGVFRTQNGGKTFERVLGFDERTGAVDVVIHPTDGSTLFAALYEVRRDAFDGNDPAIRHGDQAGLFKSTDGGDTWRRLEKGLPTKKIGRIGLSLFAKTPEVLYAVVETELTGGRAPEGTDDEEVEGGPAYLGAAGENVSGGARLTQVVEASGAGRAGLLAGDVITHAAAQPIDSWDALVEHIRTARAGDTLALTVKRGEDTLDVEVALGSRPVRQAGAYLGGQRENSVRDQGPLGFETGGVFRSDDGGENWRRVNSLNPRPFYFSEIRVDPNDSETVWVLGMQLHLSRDGGATFRNDAAAGIHVDHHALWIDPSDSRHVILGNDGGLHESFDRAENWMSLHRMPLGQYYAIALDDRSPYRIFGGCQDNGSWMTPRRVRGSGVGNEHVLKINSGDGFVCAVDSVEPDVVYSESQNGALARLDLRTGARSAVQRPRTLRRWNWKTPFILSPHNPRTLYFAGEKVVRSVNRGENSEIISPEITATERGSATTLAESPVRAGVLWVGTDDGALHVSRDGGTSWTAVHQNLPTKGSLWVSHVETSTRDASSAFVVLDGHRSNDLSPHVYLTTDFGATFTSQVNGLPKQPTRVLRQDPRNQDVLYLGNEIGVYVSLNRGRRWFKLGADLPTVPVHDLALQLREGELVAGTHGRSLFVLDVSMMAEINADVVTAPSHLFTPNDVVLWHRRPEAGSFGKGPYRVPSPTTEAAVPFWIDGERTVEIEFTDLKNRVLARKKHEAKTGLNIVRWDLREDAPGRGGNRDRGSRERGGRRGGSRVPLGAYRVRLIDGDDSSTRSFEILPDPELEAGRSAR